MTTGPHNFECVARRRARDPRANIRESAIRANFICVTNEIPRCRLRQYFPIAGPINLVPGEMEYFQKSPAIRGLSSALYTIIYSLSICRRLINNKSWGQVIEDKAISRSKFRRNFLDVLSYQAGQSDMSIAAYLVTTPFKIVYIRETVIP